MRLVFKCTRISYKFKMIIITIFLILGLSIYFILLNVKKRKIKNSIIHQLNLLGPTRNSKRKYCDLEITTKDTLYLIKIIYNYKKNEISVTHKNYFELNDKGVSSKKRGRKIEGIYDLINEKVESEKEVKKIYLVYPSAKILMKAINESELEFIYPNTDCYGVNLVNFDEINMLKK